MLPTIENCYRIIYESGMLENIVQHSFKVSRVAELISVSISDAGSRINTELIKKSALLHDITKTRSIKTRENHAETGGDMIRSLGYREMAEIIRQHVRLDSYDFEGEIKPEEIVNYADKRVVHDKIVSLDDRMLYILEIYGTDIVTKDRIKVLWDKTKELEKKIFRLVPFGPFDIEEKAGDDDSDIYLKYISESGNNFKLRDHDYLQNSEKT